MLSPDYLSRIPKSETPDRIMSNNPKPGLSQFSRLFFETSNLRAFEVAFEIINSKAPRLKGSEGAKIRKGSAGTGRLSLFLVEGRGVAVRLHIVSVFLLSQFAVTFLELCQIRRVPVRPILARRRLKLAYMLRGCLDFLLEH